MMRYQDQLVKMTQRALDDLSRAAEALPVEFRDWSPGGEARSAVDQLREIAKSASWLRSLVEPAGDQGFEAHPSGKERPMSDGVESALPGLVECLREARLSTAQLCRVIASVSDSRLEEEVSLPLMGGTVMTVADVLALHYWNLVYHLGQVNQIALMQGDREMH